MKIVKTYKVSLYSIDCDDEDLKDFNLDSLEFLFEKKQLDLMGYIIGNYFIELVTKIPINIQNNYAIYKNGKMLKLDSRKQDVESFTYVKVFKDVVTGEKYLIKPKECEIKKYMEKNNNIEFKNNISKYKEIGSKYYQDYKNYQKTKVMKKNRH